MAKEKNYYCLLRMAWCIKQFAVGSLFSSFQAIILFVAR